MTAALALLSSLLWGTADFFGGTATRRLPVVWVLLGSQGVALVAVAGVAALRGGPLVPSGSGWPGILAGLIGVIALAAFYRALALGTMGVVAPVAALGVAVPVVAGLVAGEAPSAAQAVGIVVAVAGVVLASGPELDGLGRGGATPLLLALGAALGFGVVILLLARGSGGAAGGLSAVLGVLLVMRLTSVLLLTGVVAVLRRSGGLRSARGGDLPLLGLVGLFDVGANATFAVASQGGLVSVTAVLASLYPVVTAVLARQVHTERLRAVQVAGVAAALTGVVLLAAG